MRLHAKVYGVVHCMRCYSLQRRQNAVTKVRQRAAVRRYRVRNRVKLNTANAEYIKKRYHNDPEFRKRLIKSVTAKRRENALLRRARKARGNRTAKG